MFRWKATPLWLLGSEDRLVPGVSERTWYQLEVQHAKWVPCGEEKRVNNCSSFFLLKITIVLNVKLENWRNSLLVFCCEKSGPTRTDVCPQGGMRLVFFHEWGLCSPIILLFRTEPKQWGRGIVSCSKGSAGYLWIGSGVSVFVRWKLNHYGLSVKFFLSLSHKPYKQNSDHCYACSLLMSSWHTCGHIFISVPWGFLVFFLFFSKKFIFSNWSPFSEGKWYIEVEICSSSIMIF